MIYSLRYIEYLETISILLHVKLFHTLSGAQTPKMSASRNMPKTWATTCNTIFDAVMAK